MNLTATDRASLIRLASSLPVGDENRRAILEGLKVAASRLTKKGDVLVSRSSTGRESWEVFYMVTDLPKSTGIPNSILVQQLQAVEVQSDTDQHKIVPGNPYAAEEVVRFYTSGSLKGTVALTPTGWSALYTGNYYFPGDDYVWRKGVKKKAILPLE